MPAGCCFVNPYESTSSLETKLVPLTAGSAPRGDCHYDDPRRDAHRRCVDDRCPCCHDAHPDEDGPCCRAVDSYCRADGPCCRGAGSYCREDGPYCYCAGCCYASPWAGSPDEAHRAAGRNFHGAYWPHVRVLPAHWCVRNGVHDQIAPAPA